MNMQEMQENNQQIERGMQSIERSNNIVKYSLWTALIASTIGLGIRLTDLHLSPVNVQDKLIEPHVTRGDYVEKHSGITTVYKGQNKSECASGDVEKTLPVIEKGKLLGMVVYCKSEAAGRPAK
jgi:hypothetical protein